MYQITDYTRQKAKEINVEVRPSTIPTKKIDVISNGEVVASIGQRGAEDYPHYIQKKGKAYADQRRRLYYIRHPHNTLNEMLSKWLLW